MYTQLYKSKKTGGFYYGKQENRKSETDANSSETVLKLSDALPDFTIHGYYKEGKMDTEEDGEFEMLWAYDGDDNAEYRYVRAYKWAAEDKSLLEAAKEDALFYYPEQEPEVIICDFRSISKTPTELSCIPSRKNKNPARPEII